MIYIRKTLSILIILWILYLLYRNFFLNEKINFIFLSSVITLAAFSIFYEIKERKSRDSEPK